MTQSKTIYCVGCGGDVEARLTDGSEMYPHRKDLYKLPFWVCDTCKSFVGCHHKTDTPTKPLGVLANQEMKDARKKIHALIDPLWRSGRMKRGQVYAYITHRFGRHYHSGELRTLDEAREVYKIAAKLHNEILEVSDDN